MAVKDAPKLQFASREEFRAWLDDHCLSVQGVWLVFGKKGGPDTIRPDEALEEALCFGWIDGQLRSIDETVYVKYFAQRRRGSNWSEKNKGLIDSMERQGRMTDYGRAKVEEAKTTGRWDSPANAPVTDEDVNVLAQALKGTEPACSNFLAMSSSVRRTYAGAYRAAVSDETRARRLAQFIERLNNNLKPM
ncbi:MAG: YdeI/OmpD-associated family protein [Armatimonadetes bacterium]|nr:YdeI/OmpD-associated family protein [Armatimonadota bacterium]